MILPRDGKVLVPRLSVLCLRQPEVVAAGADHLVIQPGASHPLQEILVILSLLGLVEHVEQRDVLPPVEAEVLDEVIKVRGFVLYWFPNNLRQGILCTLSS